MLRYIILGPIQALIQDIHKKHQYDTQYSVHGDKRILHVKIGKILLDFDIFVQDDIWYIQSTKDKFSDEFLRWLREENIVKPMDWRSNDCGSK